MTLTDGQPTLDLNLTDNTQPTDNPGTCRCGQPRKWMPVLQQWGRYCGGDRCNSTRRTCQHCGTTFDRGVGDAGTKFCSRECRDLHHRDHLRARATTCAWCGKSDLVTDARGRSYHTARAPQGEYVCTDCTDPIRTVIGRLRRHHVPLDLQRQLAADPTCAICHADLVTPIRGTDGKYRARLVVDHDHACCPGPTSCGRCIRGLLCLDCNLMIGQGRDDPETLEAGAAYLRAYRLRDVLREDHHGALITEDDQP